MGSRAAARAGVQSCPCARAAEMHAGRANAPSGDARAGCTRRRRDSRPSQQARSSRAAPPATAPHRLCGVEQRDAVGAAASERAARRVTGTLATVVSTSEDPAAAPPSTLDVGRQAGSAWRSSHKLARICSPLAVHKWCIFTPLVLIHSNPRVEAGDPATRLMLPDAVLTRGSIETGLRRTFVVYTSTKYPILKRSMR